MNSNSEDASEPAEKHSDTTVETSPRTASLVRTLCDAEGKQVVLRFDEMISAPTGKYNGRSYQTGTLPKATLNTTIDRASVEDGGMTLMCSAEVTGEELTRVGIDQSVIGGEPGKFRVEVLASRQWDKADTSLSNEKIERAIDEGREEDILPPWDGLPTVTVAVERTQECMRRSYESDFHIQYSSPDHEMGTLIDVRIK